jgi:hypothetical protein
VAIKEIIMKRLNVKLALALASASLLPAAGFAAEGLSYNFAELSYVNLDVDQPGEDTFPRGDLDNGNGYKVDFSVALGNRFFVYGNYANTNADLNYRDNNGVVLPGDTDIIKAGLGIGATMPVSTNTDFVVSGGYLDVDFDKFRFGATGNPSLHDLGDDTSDGFSIDAMLRSQLMPKLEGSIGARYIDVQTIDGFSVIANLMYEFTPNWGLNLSVDAGSDLATWAAGVRYSF